MKLSVFTLIFLCMGVLSSAQTFEVGYNVGLAMNTGSGKTFDTAVLDKSNSSPKLYNSLSVAYNLRSWKFGISASLGSLYFMGHQWHHVYIIYEPGMVDTTVIARNKFVLCNQFVPIKAFVNKGFAFGHTQIYIGANGGYCFGTNDNYGRFDGFTLGGQLGVNQLVSKHFALNLELQGNYVHMQNHEPVQRYFSVLDFPLTIGLRYYMK